jgi:5-methylcytosine-specific restriction endonuclease McrA
MNWTSYKDKIIELKASGLGYRSISRELGVPIVIARYYSNPAYRKSSIEKTYRFRKSKPVEVKLHRLIAMKMKDSVRNDGKSFDKHPRGFYTECAKTLLLNPVCYITGDPIDFEKFQLDHKIPKSRGGTDNIENLALTTPEANQMKGKMLIDELVQQCIKVLTIRGYSVSSTNFAQ